MRSRTAFFLSVVLLISLTAGEIGYLVWFHPYLTPATLRLQWYHQAQFAGFYVAKDKGFYRDENIDLDIHEGGMDVDVPGLVGDAKETFGIATGSQVLDAYDHQKNIKAVGAVFHKSLACFMVRADSDIYSPQNFAGKTIAVYRGFDTETIYRELLHKVGVDPTKINEVPATVDIAGFLSGKVDVWPSYVPNEPLTAEEHNIRVRLIEPKAFDIESYSDTVIVSERTHREHHDLVSGFLRASEKGWRKALQDPDAAVQAVLRYRSARYADLKSVEAHEKLMMTKIGPYVSISDPLFQMNPDVWRSMARMLHRDHPTRPEYIERLCDFEIATSRAGQWIPFAGFTNSFVRMPWNVHFGNSALNSARGATHTRGELSETIRQDISIRQSTISKPVTTFAGDSRDE